MNNQPKNSARLSQDERSKLRGEFLAYMDMHPTVEVTSRHSPYFSFSLFRAPVTYALTAVFLLGGTAYASERALPADLLYGVKTEVLEPAVLGSVAFSPPLKAKVAAALVERRLDEAETLAQSARLGEEESDTLAEKLEEHVAVIATAAAESDARETEEMIDIGIEVEASLAVHSELLTSEEDVFAAASLVETEASDTTFAGKLRELSAVTDEITASAEERLVDSLGDGVEYVKARASEVSVAVETATTTEAYELLTAGKAAQELGDLDAALASFRAAEQATIESRLESESAER